MLKFNIQYKGFKSEYFVEGDEVRIGRRQGRHEPDVCLNMDMRVQALHARMTRQGEDWYVEPVNGRRDVRVNGELIDMPMIVTPRCEIRISQTEVRFEPVIAPSRDTGGSWREVKIASHNANVITDPLGEQLMIQTRVDAAQKASDFFDVALERDPEKIALIGTLPMLLAEEENLDALANLVLDKVLNVIQGAERGAVFVVTADEQEFDLCASRPAKSPPYSRALLNRAMSERHGFIWSVYDDELVTDSIFHLSIASGIYTPLIAEGEIVGAFLVDNRRDTDAFSEEDLQFFMAVARCTAAAIADRLRP